MRHFLLSLPFTLLSFLPAVHPPVDRAGDLKNDILSYTNQFRQSRGLPPLTLQEDLNALALAHSTDMAKGRVGFGHDGFDRREAEAFKKITTARSFAENVAYGASTGEEVVNLWKSSAGHRKNMLGKYRFIGIGTARNKAGVIYYTEVFAD
jgi:uncharacterized protein YkwD